MRLDHLLSKEETILGVILLGFHGPAKFDFVKLAEFGIAKLLEP